MIHNIDLAPKCIFVFAYLINDKSLMHIWFYQYYQKFSICSFHYVFIQPRVILKK